MYRHVHEHAAPKQVAFVAAFTALAIAGVVYFKTACSFHQVRRFGLPQPTVSSLTGGGGSSGGGVCYTNAQTALTPTAALWGFGSGVSSNGSPATEMLARPCSMRG